MKKKWLLLPMSMVLGFLVILAFQEFTQAQAPSGGNRQAGGPPSGMMMVMQILPLESEWTQISFAMDVSDEAFVKARKVFKDTWTKRKALTDKAESAGDDANAKRALRTDLEKLKKELDAKLKGILTPKQLEDLAKWEKENKNRFQQRQSGGPGGGQPGGNRPQR